MATPTRATDSSPPVLELVRALHDYAPPDGSCLSLRKGDIIRVHHKDASGWWDGSIGQTRGWFPSNYIEPIRENNSAEHPAWSQTDPEHQSAAPHAPRHARQSQSSLSNLSKRTSGSSASTGNPLSPTAAGPTNKRSHPSMGSLGIPEPRMRGSSLANAVKQLDSLSQSLERVMLDSEHSQPSPNSPHNRQLFSPDSVVASASRNQFNPTSPHLQINTHAFPSASPTDPRQRQPQQLPQRTRQLPNQQSEYDQADASYRNEMHDQHSNLAVPGNYSQTQLPPNWFRKVNPTNGQVYYYNTVTNHSTYDINEVLRSTKITHRRSIVRMDDRFVANTEKPLPPPKPTQTPTSDWSGSLNQYADSSELSDALVNNILRAISNLNYAAKNQIKSRYVDHTYQIVRAVRDMLASSGTISIESDLVKSNPKLSSHHSNIMSCLSKLILGAKVASGIWPPPDAANSMRYQAGQVLLAIRHFVALGRELNLPLIRAPQSDMSMFDITGMNMSDQELLARMDTYSKNILEKIATLITFITHHKQLDQDIITSTRECVIHVGELLSMVEDLPLSATSLSSSFNRSSLNTSSSMTDRPRPESSMLVSSFVSQMLASKDQLYTYANDLINLVSNIEYAHAPGHVLGSMLESATHLSAAVETTVIAAKLVIDNREDFDMVANSDQIAMSTVTTDPALSTATITIPSSVTNTGASTRVSLSQTNRSSDLSNLQKKTMSLTYLSEISSSTTASGIHQHQPVSSTVSTGPPQSMYGRNSVGSGASGDTNSMYARRPGSGMTKSTSLQKLPQSYEAQEGAYGADSSHYGSDYISKTGSVPDGMDIVGHYDPSRLSVRQAADPNTPSAYSGSQTPVSAGHHTGLSNMIPQIPRPRKSSISSSISHHSTGTNAQPTSATPYEQDDLMDELNNINLNNITSASGPNAASSNPNDPTVRKLLKFFGDSDIAKRVANRGRQEPQRPVYLSRDYKPEDITMNMEGGISGGTFEALIERLTLHDQPVDPGFANAFLMTFHLFSSTEELFNALVARYNISPPPGLTEADLKIWVDKKLVPIQIRVSNAFKLWLESHWMDDKDDAVLDRLHVFASDTMMRSHAPLATRLLELVEKKIQADVIHQTTPKLKRVNAAAKPEDMPALIVPKSLGATGKRLQLLDIDPLEVARQLALMEFTMFARIRPIELMRQEWTRKKNSMAVNVRAMSHMSTHIANWVVATVLTDVDAKRRAAIIKFFVKVGDRCLNINNYNTLMAIHTGLNASTVSRLRKTWEHVSTKTRTTFDNLKKATDHSRNYAEYRSILKKANLPALPFLGLFLTDLTFTEDGNPDRRGPDNRLINFDKYAKTSKLIQGVIRYQSAPFALMDVPEIQEFLAVAIEREGKREPQELYELSLLLEPRETDGYSGGPPSSVPPPSAGPVDRSSNASTAISTSTTATALASVANGAMGVITSPNPASSSSGLFSPTSSQNPANNTPPDDPSRNIEQKIRMLERAGML